MCSSAASRRRPPSPFAPRSRPRAASRTPARPSRAARAAAAAATAAGCAASTSRSFGSSRGSASAATSRPPRGARAARRSSRRPPPRRRRARAARARGPPASGWRAEQLVGPSTSTPGGAGAGAGAGASSAAGGARAGVVRQRLRPPARRRRAGARVEHRLGSSRDSARAACQSSWYAAGACHRAIEQPPHRRWACPSCRAGRRAAGSRRRGARRRARPARRRPRSWAAQLDEALLRAPRRGARRALDHVHRVPALLVVARHLHGVRGELELARERRHWWPRRRPLFSPIPTCSSLNLPHAACLPCGWAAAHPGPNELVLAEL